MRLTNNPSTGTVLVLCNDPSEGVHEMFWKDYGTEFFKSRIKISRSNLQSILMRPDALMNLSEAFQHFYIVRPRHSVHVERTLWTRFHLAVLLT